MIVLTFLKILLLKSDEIIYYDTVTRGIIEDLHLLDDYGFREKIFQKRIFKVYVNANTNMTNISSNVKIYIFVMKVIRKKEYI